MYQILIGISFFIIALIVALTKDLNEMQTLIVFFNNIIMANIWLASDRIT